MCGNLSPPVIVQSETFFLEEQPKRLERQIRIPQCLTCVANIHPFKFGLNEKQQALWVRLAQATSEAISRLGRVRDPGELLIRSRR